MYPFGIRYATSVVFILTQQLIFACIAVPTCERTLPAEVFAGVFKAPWINFNSSRKDEVTTQCGKDVTTVLQNADAGEMWALQMLDAASKIPSGILIGNIFDFGMYDECIGVKDHENAENIQGQHCMVSLTIPSKFVRNASAIMHIQRISLINPTADVDPSLTLSVCLPLSCGVQDVIGFANASIQSKPELAEFEVSIAQVKCSGDESVGDPIIGTILTVITFAFIISVLLFCTVCDLVVRIRSKNTSSTLETLAKFSLYTNGVKLLSTKPAPGNMPVIDGIRFLSTFLVILLHRSVLTLLAPIVNLTDISKLRQSPSMSFLVTLPYVVDTFILLAAFLATHSYLKKLRARSGENTVLKFYLHRYIRLAPSMCVVVLFTLFIAPHLRSGPLWQSLLEDAIGNCRKNWWANLLFIQNYANREAMCIPHAWSSAVEMQLFLLSPIILYPLFYRPKLGLTMLYVLLIAALITPAIHIVVNNHSFLFDDTKTRHVSYVQFFHSYTTTHNRALPYLIGILLGYDVVNNKRRVTKLQAALNWILACIFMAFCFWSGYLIQPNAIAYDAVSEAVHVSFGRLGWSLAMAWILYACTQGYGGPITRFLSLPIFVPLSRLSYNIYLVHFLLQIMVIARKRVAEFVSEYDILYPIWGDVANSIMIAIVLNLCIETPALVLEEVITAKRPTAIMNSAPTIKQKEVSTIMDKYFDLIEGLVDSNLAIEMRMPQTDCWITMSNALNILGKAPTKTPAEWEKAWQDWKEDTQWESRVKNFRHEAAQSQTKVPAALGQELLIFLVAVSCGLNDHPNSKKSDIIKLARLSPLGPGDLKVEDPIQSLISDSAPFAKKTN